MPIKSVLGIEFVEDFGELIFHWILFCTLSYHNFPYVVYFRYQINKYSQDILIPPYVQLFKLRQLPDDGSSQPYDPPE